MANDRLSATFSALADPTRRAILARLSAGPATVKELSAPFVISGPAISRHLRVLADAGLIVQGREAQRRPCRLVPEPLQAVSTWAEQFRPLRDANFARLDALILELSENRDVP